jgi:hypothetical protein
MPSPAYHRRQADTLIRLASSTRDPDTAAALMKLAAEHNHLAEMPEGQQQQQIQPKKADK